MKCVQSFGWVALLSLAAPAGVIYLTVTYVGPLEGSLLPVTLLAVVLVLLLAAPAVYQLIRYGQIFVLQPLIIFTLYVFLGYVCPIPSFVRGSDAFTRLFGATFYTDLNKSLAWALVVVILGVIGFYLGHGAIRLRPRTPSQFLNPVRPFDWNRERFLTIGAIYTVTGLGLFGVGVVLVGGLQVMLSKLGDRLRLFAGLNYFIEAINLLAVIALIWWVYVLRERRQFRRVSFWVYTVIAVGLGSLQGNKSTLFIVVLSGTILYHLTYKKIAVVTMAAGAVVVFFLLTLYALYVREYLANGHFATIDPSRLSDTLPQALDAEYGGNFIQIQALTLLVDRMPAQLPYQTGKTYLALVTNVVPRVLWPEKLLPSTGVFTLAFRPELWLNQGTTVPPGLLGEMYMNFGPAGVFVGMFLCGTLIGLVVDAAERRPDHPRPLLVYALLTALLPHYLRGDFVGGTTMFAIFILPLLVAVWLIGREPGRLSVRARGVAYEFRANAGAARRRLDPESPTRLLHLRRNQQPDHR
jgi:hypothetical protein